MECQNKKHNQIREKLQNCDKYIESVNNVSKIFSLLGDASRMKIVLSLMEGELCVYHICQITGAKQSATSQHLRKLKDSGIIKSRKEGNQVLYSLKDGHVKTIIKTALIHQDC